MIKSTRLPHRFLAILPIAILAFAFGLEALAAQDARLPPGGLIGGESWKTDFSRATVPLSEILPGGPPKDGIPAIDRPRFETVDQADRWLSGRDPVAVVTRGGAVRIYPLQILMWHEIVNDHLGGQPVTVTFCPLCNTTLAFDRRLDERVLDFGTTGRLRHSDLVMYDRQTESWWQQATGEAIVGELAGARLEFIPSPVLSWSEAKAEYPTALVLSRDTGFERDYGRNPYSGYDRRSGPLAGFFTREDDGRLPAMERVVALWDKEEALAIPFSSLRERRVIQSELAGEPLVVFWAPGTASALDATQIDQGRDIGSTNVFRPVVDGRALTFEPARGDQFRDRETRSTWNMSGRATSGSLQGQVLEPVTHGNHFWFAWAAFQPETRIIRRE